MRASLATILTIGLALGGLAPPARADAVVADSRPACRKSLASEEPRARCLKEWTLVIHMAADNDLAAFAIRDLEELESVGSSPEIDVLVQLDLPGADGVRTYQIKKSRRAFDPGAEVGDYDPRAVGRLKSPVLRTHGEKRATSEEKRLRDFLAWSAERHPSRHVMAVVWGHGKGWSASLSGRDGGFGMGDSGRRALSIPALRRALAGAGRTIDVFVADACLMQSAEVLAELAPAADYLIGSSQNQEYLGLPYRDVLAAMADARGEEAASAVAVASRLPAVMKEFLARAAAQGLASRERAGEMGMSAVTSREFLNVFLPSMKRLSAALVRAMSLDLRTQLGLAARETISFENGSLELGNFARNLDWRLARYPVENGEPVRRALAETIETLDRAVLAYSFGNGVRDFGKRSLSLWIPARASAYRARIEDFDRSSFYPATGFGEFLRAWHSGN